jgi:Rrf2 family iron-sulfur cluster assembly transcriptional regulator
MLTLTKKAEYALIALCHLSRVPRDTVVSAREMAESHHVPLPLLMNVLKSLSQTGLINSTRGARGGYQLASDPSEITLRDLVESVEGPVRFVACVNTSQSNAEPCERAAACTIRRPLHRVHESFQEFLGTVSVAELVSSQYTDPLPLNQSESECVTERATA